MEKNWGDTPSATLTNSWKFENNCIFFSIQSKQIFHT